MLRLDFSHPLPDMTTGLPVIARQLHEPAVRKGYRQEIDGLRAFAVIAVIVNHFNKTLLPGGYLGVDIFFVVSGYVITSSLSGRPRENLIDFIGGFYERRVRRLVPALAVFVVVTSIAICLFNPDPDFHLAVGKRALFGISNIALYGQSTDYFAQSTELNPFTHTWSLGVEEQFYVVFPFLVWFSGFGGRARKGGLVLALVIGLLAIASFAGFLFLYSFRQPAAYFLMPPRFWEIASGCLVFIAMQGRVPADSCLGKVRFLWKVPPLLVVVLLIGVMFLPLSLASLATVAVVVLTSLLVACLDSSSLVYRLFTDCRIVSIGLISYSLYLWHWGVLSISRWTIGIHWWTVPFQVALMLGLAAASYRWVETPLRRRTWFGRRWQTLLVGAGILASSAAGVQVLARPMRGTLYTGRYQYEALITGSRGYESAADAYNEKNCHRANDRFVLSQLLSRCLLNGAATAKMIYFLGNSHADHLRETHYLLNRRDGVGVASMTISSCTFPQRVFKGCEKGSQKQIEAWMLQRLSKGDVVVISNRHIANSQRLDQRFLDYPWMKDRSTIAGINALNQEVQARGGRMVLLMPLPEYEVSIEECKPVWFRPFRTRLCSKSVRAARAERSRVYSLVSAYLDRSVLVYDPLAALCIQGECAMTDARAKPLYIDNNHITDYANRLYVYPSFREFLRKNGLI